MYVYIPHVCVYVYNIYIYIYTYILYIYIYIYIYIYLQQIKNIQLSLNCLLYIHVKFNVSRVTDIH